MSNSDLETHHDQMISVVVDNIETIEQYLNDPTLGKRIEAIDSLRTNLRDEASTLSILGNYTAKVTILQALERCLSDRSWEIRHKAIQFISEVIECDKHAAEYYMFPIIPPLARCVADANMVVRHSAVHTLQCYLRYANDQKLALFSFVKYGFDNLDATVQREWCVSLPMLLASDVAKLDYADLVRSLVRKLESRQLSMVAFTGLQYVAHLIGSDAFQEALKQLPVSARLLYAHHERKLSSQLASPHTGRVSVISETLAESDELAVSVFVEHASSLDAMAARQATTEEMLTKFVSDHPPDDKATLSLRRMAGEDIDFDCDEEDGYDGKDEEHVKFSWLPTTIFDMLQDSNVQIRLAGSEELKKRVQLLSNYEIRRMEPHLLAFISYMNELLDDSTLRFIASVLESFAMFVVKVAAYLLSSASQRGSLILSIETDLYIRHILAILMKRLSENRSILRQMALKTIIQLMHTFQKPTLIIDQLSALSFFSHRNSRIRQESLNLLIVALLTYPSTSFDLTKLTGLVAALLNDTKRQVRLAAFECIAVLAQALGTANRQLLLNAIDQVELEIANGTMQQDTDDLTLMNAVQTRLARRQLPRLVRPSSGELNFQVEYALQLPSASQLRQYPFATLSHDFKWIMAASAGSSAALSSSFSQLHLHPDGADTEPIRAWPSPTPPSRAAHPHTDSARQTDPALNTDDVVPTSAVSASINHSALRHSTAKLRKLLPWEQELDANDADKTVNSSESNATAITRATNGSKQTNHDTPAPASAPASHSNGQLYAPHKTTEEPENATDRANLQSENLSTHTSGLSGSPLFPHPPAHPRNLLAVRSGSPNVRNVRSPLHKRSFSTEERTTVLPGLCAPHAFQSAANGDSFDSAVGIGTTSQRVPTAQMNRNGSTKDSVQPKPARSPLAYDSDSDDPIKPSAIELIRNSAAKKRAERLERLRAANETRSAPPHVTPMQHQLSLPNASGLQHEDDVDDTDTNVYSFNCSDDEVIAEDSDDDSGLSARSRMSQKLMDSMNRKNKQLQRGLNPPAAQSAYSYSQRKVALPRLPPAATKNAMSARTSFNSNAGLSKSAGAICSGDDEQMQRDLQFLADKPPAELLRIALSGMNNSNSELWDEKCRCLNIVRFLAREHTAFLQSEFRAIRLPVLREVRNLRTQVNRLALRTFGDLFEYLGKVTETDLDATVELLLPRAGDTNKFIQQEVQDAMMRLARFVSPAATVPTLIRCGGTHRNPLVRRTTAQFVAISVQRFVSAQPTRSSLHETAQEYALAASNDADPECRQYGRQLLATMGVEAKRDSNNNSDRKHASAPPSKAAPASGRTGKKQTQGVPIQVHSADLPTIASDLVANDWQTRLRGVEAYQQYLAHISSAEIGPSYVKTFELFCKRLNDNNAKVTLGALQALHSLYPSVLQRVAFDDAARPRDALPLSVCIDNLLPNLASRNEQVFSLANEIIDNLIGDLMHNATELIAPICAYYQSFQNDMARAYLLEKLSYIVPRTYAKQSAVIQAKLIPFVSNALNGLSSAIVRDLINSTLSTTQSAATPHSKEAEQVKCALVKLLKSLYRQMKGELAPSIERQKVNQLVTLLAEQQVNIEQFVTMLVA